MSNPKVVIVLSGKRKSGKDHIADILDKVIRKKVILRISAPIKRQFTEQNGLDFRKSLTSSEYKESFRLEMIKWSESVRKSDPDCFLKQDIIDKGAKEFPIWILADARRMTDVKYFQERPEFDTVSKFFVRIVTSEEVRKNRGWIFTPGVDDVESECGLDGFTDWTLVVKNDDLSEEQILKVFQSVLDECNKYS